MPPLLASRSTTDRRGISVVSFLTCAMWPHSRLTTVALPGGHSLVIHTSVFRGAVDKRGIIALLTVSRGVDCVRCALGEYESNSFLFSDAASSALTSALRHPSARALTVSGDHRRHVPGQREYCHWKHVLTRCANCSLLLSMVSTRHWTRRVRKVTRPALQSTRDRFPLLLAKVASLPLNVSTTTIPSSCRIRNRIFFLSGNAHATRHCLIRVRVSGKAHSVIEVTHD